LDSAFRLADRLAVMDAGHLVAEGRTDEIRASTQPFVRRFLATHFEVARS
jgi:ABC-type proline/glycine betaine transport system ATPase subunit